MAGFLEGLLKITAQDVGKKIGLSLINDVLTGPFDFFLKKGIEELFGGSGEQFKQVLQKLEEVEKEIKQAVLQISTVVVESDLEKLHSDIGELYENFKTTLDGYNTVSDGYSGAYDSLYKTDPVSVLTQIGSATEQIHDILIGSEVMKSTDYLDEVTDKMYQENTGIYAFNTQLNGVSALFVTDLINASLICTCILLHATDNNHKNIAAAKITDIGTYIEGIADYVETINRDIPERITEIKDSYFMLHCKAKDHVLGRYVEYSERSYHLSFELQQQVEGYFYLNIIGKDWGIDHYYGKDIKLLTSYDYIHPQHMWKFVASENDPRWFRIQNKASGQILDHYDGQFLRAVNLDEHPNHLWQILPNREGNGCHIINKATGAALGLDHKNRLNAYTNAISIGINIGSYNPNLQLPPGTWDNTYWKMLRHEATEFHNLVNKVAGAALDYYDGESFRFVPSPSGHPNHLWKLEPTTVDDTNVYYFLRNQATGRVLDYNYGNDIKGVNENNAKSPPHQEHLWKLVKV